MSIFTNLGMKMLVAAVAGQEGERGGVALEAEGGGAGGLQARWRG